MGWLSGWAKRIELTIDCTKIDSDLTDFPILVYVSDTSGIGGVDASCVFAELGSGLNQYKIAVTTSDGETECYVEIETWDQESEKAWLHVCVPSISSSVDTTLYLYYDSDHLNNIYYVFGYNPYVWVSGHETVLHMASSPVLPAQIMDSTENANHGTSNGSMTIEDLVDGQVGKGIDFDGVDDWLDLDGPVYLDEFSVIVLGKISNYSDNPGICGDQVNYLNGRLAILSGGGSIRWRASDTISLTDTFPTDQYFLLTITRDASGNINVYKNDTDITSGSPNFTQELKIWRVAGNPNNTSDKPWYGIMDEIQILSECISSAWVKATYYSLFDDLITFGSEEISIVSVSTENVSYTAKNPIIIPFFVKIPLESLRLESKNPSFEWYLAPQTQYTARAIYRLILTGSPDITIPMSSFQCRMKKIPASGIYDIWEPSIPYEEGDQVIPTIENGFVYECVNIGGGTSGETEPIWPIYQRGDGWPITYFQVWDGYALWENIADTGKTYIVSVDVVVPDITWLSEISARGSGRIRIYKGLLFSNGDTQLSEIVNAILEKFGVEKYSRKNHITLYGYEKKSNTSPKTVVLTGASGYWLNDGKITYKCEINDFLRLGDTANINGDQFTVGEISYTVTPRGQSMEIVEE